MKLNCEIKMSNSLKYDKSQQCMYSTFDTNRQLNG